MRLLILGGTKFVGRHLAEAALDRGWDVSLFHRGKSNPDILPEATHLNGDRLEDLSALDGKKWDFCVDTSAYVPRAVRLAGERLRDQVDRVAFISTVSVYADVSQTEVGYSPLHQLEDPTTEEVNGETYGGLKVLCEQVLEELWPEDKRWIIRPGIIAGPYDPTDRFTYWVDRVAHYRAFVKPLRMNQPVQAVDARALGEFILDGLLAGHHQTVNTVGPAAEMDFDHLLKKIRKELNAESYELLPRPEDIHLPLELPKEYEPMFRVDPQPAIELGLQLPGIKQTIRATYEWWIQQNRPLSTEPENSPDVRRESNA